MNTRPSLLGILQAAILTAVALAPSTAQAAANPLDDWTLVHPQEALSPWGPVAYGNGRYVVATSDAGKPEIMWSSNAVEWMAAPTNFGFYYDEIVFAEGKFWLAGGEDDPPATILTSTDGVHWDVAFSDWAYESFGQLRYSAGTFVARASTEDGPDALVASTNGVDWFYPSNAPYIALLEQMDGKWLGIAFPLAVHRSTNGLDWSSGTSLETASSTWVVGSASGAQTFLAFGSSSIPDGGGGYRYVPFITWTTDGLNWSNSTIPSVAAQIVKDIVHGTNGFIAVAGNFGSPELFILHSTDGQTWQVHPFPVQTSLGQLSFADGLYFLAGAQGVIFTSPDGLQWTQPAGASTRQLRGLAEGSSGLVAVGNRGLLLTSSDGTAWTRHDGVTQEDLAAIVAQSGRYTIAGGTTNAFVLRSADGTTWHSFSSIAHGALRSAVIGAGTDVLAVGLKGAVARIISGGIQFHQSPEAQDFHGVTRFRNQFLAVATATGPGAASNAGGVYSSTDGLVWTRRFTNSSSLLCISASPSRVVAAGALGVAFISSNGDDWQPISISSNGGDWLSIAYGDGVFVTPGNYGNNNGKVFSSGNGVDWQEHEFISAPLSGYLPNVWNEAVLYGGYSWVAHTSDRFYVGVGPEYLWRSGRVTHRLHSPARHASHLAANSSGVPGAISRMQYSVDLVNWTDIGATTNSAESLSLPMNTGEAQRFYRIVSE